MNHLAAIFWLIHMTQQSQAVVPCFHKDLRDYGNLTQKIAEYADSPTRRETIETYADLHKDKYTPAQVAENVAATGRLTCKPGELSANLVVKGDILLTANHVFSDPSTCKSKAKPQSCTFAVTGKKPVRVKNLEASGSRCPEILKDAGGVDWAILRLEKPIDGVAPYKLPDVNPRDGINPGPVIAVGDLSLDFRKKDPKTGQITFPKHVQDCSVRDVYYRYDPNTLGSDCDGGEGKSGGAMLGANLIDHVIVGITVGNRLSDAEIKKERTAGTPTRRNYDSEKFFNSGIAIEGRLLDELKKVTR